jgi:hypothetical protein
MAALSLPDEFKAGIHQIVSMSDEAARELVALLEGAPMSFAYEDLSASIADTIKGISPEDLDETIETLVSLYAVRDSVSVALAEFVDDVTEAVEETDLKEELSQLTSVKFKERLAVLLNIKALAFTSQARARQRAHEKMFCTGEMLTDMRPVFGLNGDGAPIAAVITHTLKFSYHHGRFLKDISVGLSPDDLDQLEDLIDQARFESGQLRSILDAANVPYPAEDE